MFTRRTLAVVLLFGLFAASHAFAEYYKYRGKDGILRFTDNLAEVPPDQRPKVKRYDTVKPVPQDGGKADRSRRKKADAPSKRGPQNRVQTAAQALLQEQKDLEELYKKLMNEKMALANDSHYIQSAEDAKRYRRSLKDLNERIANFENRRYKYLNQAGKLKEEIEKEQERQNRPPKFTGNPRTCGGSRTCSKKTAAQ